MLFCPSFVSLHRVNITAFYNLICWLYLIVPMFVYFFLILTHGPFFSPLVFKVVVLIDLNILHKKCYIFIFIYWVMEAKEEDDIIPEWWNVLSSISWHCQSRAISNQVHGIILPDQVKWASAVATAVSLELQCLILLFSHSSCLFALFLSVHRNQRSVQQPCHRLNVKLPCISVTFELSLM